MLGFWLLQCILPALEIESTELSKWENKIAQSSKIAFIKTRPTKMFLMKTIARAYQNSFRTVADNANEHSASLSEM